MTHDLICKHCQKPFQGTRRDAKWCGNTCRTYASRKNVSKKDRKGKSLSGLPISPVKQAPAPQLIKTPVPNVEVSKSKEPNKLSFDDMPPIRLYREKEKKSSGNLPPAPEPPEPFTETRPEVIEPVSRLESRTKPNPEFGILKEKQIAADAQLAMCSQLLNVERLKLEQFRSESNVGANGYVGGVAIGGVLGKQLFGGFWGTVFGGALGAGAVKVFDNLTVDKFEAEKQQRVAKQMQIVHTVRKKLDELNGSRLGLSLEQSKVAALLTYTVRITTNYGTIQRRQQEITDFDQRKVQYDQLWQEYENAMQEYREKFGELLNADAEPDETTAPLVDDPSILSGAQLLQGRGGGTLLFQGKWLTFIGEPSRTFSMAIHGPSGSGKSHLAVQFGYYYNIMHGTVLYVSGEEGHSDTMTRKLSKYADTTKMNGYDFADITSKEELFKIVPKNKYHLIILDSINNMRIGAEDLQDICAHYCCSAIVAICQNTKKGEIRGSYEVVHNVQIKIRVEDGIAYTDKNRFRDDKPELEVFHIGAVPPVPRISEPKIILLNPPPTLSPKPEVKIERKDESKPDPKPDTDKDEDNDFLNGLDDLKHIP